MAEWLWVWKDPLPGGPCPELGEGNVYRMNDQPAFRVVRLKNVYFVDLASRKGNGNEKHIRLHTEKNLSKNTIPNSFSW